MGRTSSILEEKVGIPGMNRILEGRFAYPAERQPAWSALLVGPHPLLGGDLQNNLVRALLEASAGAGAAALAFNYSGVGASEGGPDDWPAVVSTFWKEGCFDEERDWVDDTRSALTALRGFCERPLAVIGYSFGCRAVAEVLASANAEAAVLVSPNPRKNAYDRLSGCRTPILVLHSDNDFTCGAGEVNEWFDKLREPKAFVLLQADEHFFRGQESEVANAVMTFLQQQGMAVEVEDDARGNHQRD